MMKMQEDLQHVDIILFVLPMFESTDLRVLHMQVVDGEYAGYTVSYGYSLHELSLRIGPMYDFGVALTNFVSSLFENIEGTFFMHLIQWSDREKFFRGITMLNIVESGAFRDWL